MRFLFHLPIVSLLMLTYVHMMICNKAVRVIHYILIKVKIPEISDTHKRVTCWEDLLYDRIMSKI